MASKKVQTSLSMVNVAEELEQIAADLRAGKFAFPGVDLSVGGQIDFKKKQRLEGGVIKYEIAMRIPLSSEDAENATAKQSEIKSKKITKKKRTNQDKQLKKKITSQWKSMVSDINDKLIPDRTLLAEFKENCEQYSQGAAAEWRPLWQKCVKTMIQAVELARDGSFDQAKERVDLAHQYKKSGHKKFK